MQKIVLLFVFVLCLTFKVNAQLNRYIIELKDKSNNTFTLAAPWEYLSHRALQRRDRYNIPIDSFDLPVTAMYVDSIRLAGDVTILNTSKWLNQVAILTTDAEALIKINSFSFVKTTLAVAPFTSTNFVVIDKFKEPVIPNPETNFAPYPLLKTLMHFTIMV